MEKIKFNGVKLEKQLELNRGWIYAEDDIDCENDPIGEKNFVISEEYFLSIFSELFPNERSLEDFLDVYEPETDGEKIYQRALADGKLIEDDYSDATAVFNVEIEKDSNGEIKIKKIKALKNNLKVL
jgi:hypothetical protein